MGICVCWKDSSILMGLSRRDRDDWVEGIEGRRPFGYQEGG